MTLLLSLPLAALALILLIPSSVLAVECLMALARPRAACRREGLEGRYVTKAVVIPAHDEALSIGRTLSALLPELEGQDRVLVVADNCTDATATVAAGLGVEVLERKDPDRRGKGFALDFALKHLRPDPPEVVVFLDADCELTPGSLEELAQVAQSRGRPAQAHYRMRQDGDLDRPGVAGFAWRLRGLVRPMGLAALGMPCQLYGTGMALPWAVLERLSLASGHIVEDMKLTLDLIDEGALPLFCADACVISAFPATEEAAAGQRRRWEHGHIATILGHGLPALWRSLRKGDPQRLALALDVCVPPLSLFLVLLALATLLILPAVLFFDLGQGALALLGLSWGLTLAGLFLAWFRFGRDLIPVRRLLLMPIYVASKLLLYLEFFTRRQKEWNRADRE
ncbi:MAG: hypothetical protein A2286_06870 [Gammaproteobacteria bacterium RIFOXYA12_FULL_61_12]|nr:MAG: hypothetical protein A2514_05790 [Gammaproteobacteria bacterium RIFOXYD12_FULL_61_37]OGT92111.1 MAG: hypothetical protein A2286_06870 [Gammaproteobacteria bacterium RIFOXYA12_FULL_61_12]